MRIRRHSAALAAVATALTLILTGLATAGSASAHVTVTAPGVTAGAADATITFRVPTESDTASTTGLSLQFPVDTPLVGVLPVTPPAGWTATATQAKLATPITTDDGTVTQVVSRIDWKAASGAGIAPGFAGQFSILVGKLPDDTSPLVFKAVQTYSDGSQVAWIDLPTAGSSQEPEHPAPTLNLSADVAGAATSSHDGVAGTATSAAAPTGTTTTVALVLGVLGAVLGAAALVLVLARGRRGRSTPTGPATSPRTESLDLVDRR